MQKRKKWIIISAAVVLVIASAAVIGSYGARHLYIRTFGLELSPSRDFPVTAVEYYLQNDSKWGGDTVGSSTRKMAGTGCLVSCVASALNVLGVDTDPGKLNLHLSENGGYEGADLIWYMLNELYPEVDYKYSREFSSETIDEDLASGLLPIVNVKYNRTGYTHWVMIVGAEDGEYLIYDPLNAGLEFAPLSVHGRVYSYRVLIPAEGA